MAEQNLASDSLPPFIELHAMTDLLLMSKHSNFFPSERLLVTNSVSLWQHEQTIEINSARPDLLPSLTTKVSFDFGLVHDLQMAELFMADCNKDRSIIEFLVSSESFTCCLVVTLSPNDDLTSISLSSSEIFREEADEIFSEESADVVGLALPPWASAAFWSQCFKNCF